MSRFGIIFAALYALWAAINLSAAHNAGAHGEIVARQLAAAPFLIVLGILGDDKWMPRWLDNIYLAVGGSLLVVYGFGWIISRWRRYV